ncbi:MAG: YidC/Oxa1 family insertase periplasmic-domain containing protein [Planctomycetaceae bacterium]|jgi:YidC/Oxa1 family membrane protein insertase|nr:YidC/Oxa1 family insertase periplasmic-domain containing protein [Planctomycetaceae bacterium]
MQSFENPNDKYAAAQRQMFVFVVMLALTFFIFQYLSPPKPSPQQAANPAANVEETSGGVEDDPSTADPNTNDANAPSAPEENENPVVFPASYPTLGSADPKSPYKMLVAFSSRDAAVARIEMNKRQYRDTQDSTGWMGQIVVELPRKPNDAEEKDAAKGCPVQTVGRGTPAETAGLRVGDFIVQFDQQEITSFEDLRAALLATKPKQTCKLTVQRKDKSGKTQSLELTVQLDQAPLAIVRPETPVVDFETYDNLSGLHAFDSETQPPLSFGLTFRKLDKKELPLPDVLKKRPAQSGTNTGRDLTLARELPGVHLRSEHWELESISENEVVFKQTVLNPRLEVRKIYRLQAATDKQKKNGDPGYALTLTVAVKNLDSQPHTVAYQLDGPNGLPIQGAWYAAGRKTGPGWGGYGLRDIVVQFHGQASAIRRCTEIAQDRGPQPEEWTYDLLKKTKLADYVGVDTQYFQCTMLPRQDGGELSHLEYIVPLRVGAHIYYWQGVTNVSFRMASVPQTLKSGESFSHEYKIFAGPKQPETLEYYGLRDTLYYGWFAWFVKPLLWLLHFFHAFLPNYALAIILLTVVVRLCLYRLNHKQMQSVMKMQEIKPEIDRITEKYKDDMQARSKAMQELYRKHHFNPLGGCLPLLIQMPILFALYKALSVDVELYGASFLGNSVRWCSDLAAPDQFYDWSRFWINIGWSGFNTGTSSGFWGMFALGPYFNILPILAVVLMLVHQQIMTPPPTTEQEKSMRRMMKFMMIFMAFMFYKVASGLCFYFIISSLWAVLERKFLPKPKTSGSSGSTGAERTVKTYPAEITVSDKKYEVKSVDKQNDGVSRKKKKKQAGSEEKPVGFWQGIKARWKKMLEEAEHRPGDSFKPGRKRDKKK